MHFLYGAKSEAINMSGICALFGARAVGYQFSVSNWVSEFQDIMISKSFGMLCYFLFRDYSLIKGSYFINPLMSE